MHINFYFIIPDVISEAASNIMLYQKPLSGGFLSFKGRKPPTQLCFKQITEISVTGKHVIKLTFLFQLDLKISEEK